MANGLTGKSVLTALGDGGASNLASLSKPAGLVLLQPNLSGVPGPSECSMSLQSAYSPRYADTAPTDPQSTDPNYPLTYNQHSGEEGSSSLSTWVGP